MSTSAQAKTHRVVDENIHSVLGKNAIFSPDQLACLTQIIHCASEEYRAMIRLITSRKHFPLHKIGTGVMKKKKRRNRGEEEQGEKEEVFKGDDLAIIRIYAMRAQIRGVDIEGIIDAYKESKSADSEEDAKNALQKIEGALNRPIESEFLDAEDHHIVHMTKVSPNHPHVHQTDSQVTMGFIQNTPINVTSYGVENDAV